VRRWLSVSEGFYGASMALPTIEIGCYYLNPSMTGMGDAVPENTLGRLISHFLL
jgi:urea transporter